ncbi:MAG: hypothetical protein U0401_12650 [Anaerolineae bacterium]
MALNISYRPIPATSTNQAAYVHEVAKKICDEAVEQAGSKLTPIQQKQSLKHLFQHPDFIKSFKYSLASGVAQTLALHDRHVQAVHLFEPSFNPDAEVSGQLALEATIHLLVVVETPSAALEALITSLDHGLIHCLGHLPSTLFAQRPLILDVSLITKEAVERQRGLGAMLSSVFAPPLKLWERNF